MPRRLSERMNPYVTAILQSLMIAYFVYRDDAFLVFLGMFIALNTDEMFGFMDLFHEDFIQHNTETFHLLTPVADIPADKRIDLDGYAFDIDELCAYADNEIYNIYRNPHKYKTDFSPEAKKIIKNHPILGKCVKELERKLAEQNSKIKPLTIDKLIIMLKDFASDDFNIVAAAQDKFMDYYYKLPDQEKSDLDNYIIELPIMGGGYQRMKFSAALAGGDVDRCINTVQMFLWQFVVALCPAAFKEIPWFVLAFALSGRNMITPSSRETALSHSGFKMTLFRSRVPLLAAIADRFPGPDVPQIKTPRLD